MRFFSILSFCAAALASVVSAQSSKGTIVKPANGTTIAAGEAFDFNYVARADYSVSTFAFSVYLFTEVARGSFSSGDMATTGLFLGRFDIANYPAVPYATNPAPAQLTMPNFSAITTNTATFFLSVIEEYSDGTQGVMGHKISSTFNILVYNGTQ